MATEAVMHEMEFGEYESTSRLEIVDIASALRSGSDALFICAETATQDTPRRRKSVQFYIFLPLVGKNYTVDSSDLLTDGRTMPLYRHSEIFGTCADGDSDATAIPVVHIEDAFRSDERLAQRLRTVREPPVLYMVDGSDERRRLIYLHESPVVAGSQLLEFEALTKRNSGSSAWALAIPGAVVIDVVTLPLQIPVYILFAMSFGDSEEDLNH